MPFAEYVHGYSSHEGDRLIDQANTLSDLLHNDTVYPSGGVVLEAGCGIGAQTIPIALKNPHTQFVSLDISEESVALARERVRAEGIGNVTFLVADIFNLPFGPETFDHILACFVLEHLPDPHRALVELKRVLRTEGTLAAIEGDHGSAYFHPNSASARRAIQCLITLQAQADGDSLIGRRLYPLLSGVGLRNVRVSPRMVYVDSSRPDLVEGFTRRTFTAMVSDVKDRAIEAGLIDEETWHKGIEGLLRTTQRDGTFCYTFFKGAGIKTC